jgi:cysteinyl-tRNA synthetase
MTRQDEEYVKQCEYMRAELARYGSLNGQYRQLVRRQAVELSGIKAAVERVMEDLRQARLYEYSDRLRDALKGESK